jgi:AbrB family looped-hinge helix DNA binding protein
MTAQTKLSAKGQVVIPKDVRDRLGLVEGTLFDVIERGEEVVLKRKSETGRGLTAAEALREIQETYLYDGPPVSLEEMRAAAREQSIKAYLAKQGK